MRQVSEQEKELLRFLIFRPIMSADIRDSASALADQCLTLEREYTGGLRREMPVREFQIPSPGTWTTRLSWTGQGRVSLQLISLEGNVQAGCEGWTSPLEISGVVVAPGTNVRVRYLEVVQKELPFCLHVASGGVPSNASALRGSLLRAKPGVPKSGGLAGSSQSPPITGTLSRKKR